MAEEPNEIILPKPSGYMTSEDIELEKKIVELRHKGFRYSEIAKITKLPYEKVLKVYKQFEKEHEDELFSAKMEKVVEIHSVYPKMISIAQEELELARMGKRAQETAGWVKITLEAAREYREFLESIGFIHKEITAETKKHAVVENTDPILELIKLNRLKLTEEMKKTGEGNDGKTTTVDTTG